MASGYEGAGAGARMNMPRRSDGSSAGRSVSRQSGVTATSAAAGNCERSRRGGAKHCSDIVPGQPGRARQEAFQRGSAELISGTRAFEEGQPRAAAPNGRRAGSKGDGGGGGGALAGHCHAGRGGGAAIGTVRGTRERERSRGAQTVEVVIQGCGGLPSPCWLSPASQHPTRPRRRWNEPFGVGHLHAACRQPRRRAAVGRALCPRHGARKNRPVVAGAAARAQSRAGWLAPVVLIAMLSIARRWTKRASERWVCPPAPASAAQRSAAQRDQRPA